MGLGRYLVEDENSVVVQAARTVQLTDDVSIQCKTREDAEKLRAHLANLKPAASSPAPAKRAPRKAQS